VHNVDGGRVRIHNTRVFQTYPDLLSSFSYSSSAGAVPSVNSVQYRSCTYSSVSILALCLLIYVFFNSHYVHPSPHRSRLRYHAPPLVFAGSNVKYSLLLVTKVSMRRKFRALTAEQISYGCLSLSTRAAYYRTERKLRGYMLTVVVQVANAVKQDFKDPQKDASMILAPR